MLNFESRTLDIEFRISIIKSRMGLLVFRIMLT